MAGSEGASAKIAVTIKGDDEGSTAAPPSAAQPPQASATAETQAHLSQQSHALSQHVRLNQREQAQDAQQAQHTQQAQKTDELMIRSRGSAESAIVNFEPVMATADSNVAGPVTGLPGNNALSSGKRWPGQMLKNLIQKLGQSCMRKADTYTRSRQQVDTVEPLPAATAALCAVDQQPSAQQGRPTTTANIQVGCLKPCTVANQIGAGCTWIIVFHLGPMPICRYDHHQISF